MPRDEYWVVGINRRQHLSDVIRAQDDLLESWELSRTLFATAHTVQADGYDRSYVVYLQSRAVDLELKCQRAWDPSRHS